MVPATVKAVASAVKATKESVPAVVMLSVVKSPAVAKLTVAFTVDEPTLFRLRASVAPAVPLVTATSWMLLARLRVASLFEFTVDYAP